jgi:hypothetical protein
MGKIAGILAAAAFAGGLTMGMTGTARADVTPGDGWAEIFSPYTSSLACLDDPGGSTTFGTPIQLFHCHGYASNGAPQRWNFAFWTNVSPGVTAYSITTQAGYGVGNISGLPAFAGARVGLKRSIIGPVWYLHSRNEYSGDPAFALELADTGYCMSLPDLSGRNGESIVLEPCDLGSALQLWNLG